MTRTIILGAGDAGTTLVREIQRSRRPQRTIVGLLDDDLSLAGCRIHGVAVLGRIDTVADIRATHHIDEALIAIPSAPAARIREIIALCEGCGLTLRIVPSLAELIEGSLTIASQLRPIQVEDLLPRPPVELDVATLQAALGDRVVLVTGAGGSIGRALCREILRHRPARLVLMEQSENGLFEAELALAELGSRVPIRACLGDIGDARRVTALLAEHQPHMICHAAAHKHVGMLESHPGEGLRNNVIGTRTLADAAAAAGVEKFVLISTDKAINPASIMGCTKRVAEMYIQALDARTATQFITVRFGNVLGSRGSVVPIFQDQIARGGPITVTHPDATRYFMTIPEAAQLVLQAAGLGRGGEIFLLEMGAPVRIIDLAHQMIRLSGMTPGVDVDVTCVGLRPGEKLHEELTADREDVAPTTHPAIRVWRCRPADYARMDAVTTTLANLVHADPERIRAALGAAVPEAFVRADAPLPLPA